MAGGGAGAAAADVGWVLMVLPCSSPLQIANSEFCSLFWIQIPEASWSFQI